MLENAKLRGLIGLALKEDIGTIDVTTTNLISKSVKIKADILTREDGVICGIPVCEAVFEHLNAEIKFKPQVNEGDYVYKGKAVCYLEGPAWPILAGERTALNFLGRLSGISTETRKFAEKVRLYGTKILDTRKTTPGLRFLEKYAVKIGGGENHRKGLWDQVLIKDNHLKLLRSKPLTMNKMLKDVRRKIQKNTKIEIEVDNLKDFEEALGGYPDIIMLENMEPGD
ncbi:MAG: carboxylating nicotinate-nucleotide diphosphorylase, partial [Candidatus Omnitrophica bacterium]|nr:carboxylating nicotinate-nucleotide diphosphorylase [Candidatus Omnitrophota bacterium]